MLELKRLPSDARWVNVENLHLTVHFLGDVREDLIPSVVSALKNAVSGVTPFTIDLKGVGVFPSIERPRVFWAGVGGETAPLYQLNRQVQSEMANIGYAANKSRFSPHLTLARIRSPLGFVDVFKRAEKLTGNKRFGLQKIASTELMLSELGPKGPKYFVLARVPLTASLKV